MNKSIQRFNVVMKLNFKHRAFLFVIHVSVFSLIFYQFVWAELNSVADLLLAKDSLSAVDAMQFESLVKNKVMTASMLVVGLCCVSFATLFGKKREQEKTRNGPKRGQNNTD